MNAPPLIVAALVAALAGSVQAILAPPTNLHWLHWIAYLPMFWVLRPDTPRRNAALGYLYGIVSVAVIFRWLIDTITLFSNLPMVLAVAVLLLFSMAFGAGYPLLWGSVHPLRKRLGVGWVLAWPAVQVLIEWVGMRVFLFPYNQGVSQYRAPLVWQIVSITGIYGATYLVLLVNAALAEAMYRRQEGRPAPWGALGGALATLALTLGFGKWRYEAVEARLRQAEVLRVAQLQSPTDMLERMDGTARQAFDEWQTLTATLEPGSVDLVVWPEGACPYDLSPAGEEPNRATRMVAQLARDGGFQLMIGGGTRRREVDPEMGETSVNVFNSVYWFTEEGEVLDQYDKMVPLPFGEYLPFTDYFPWIKDYIRGPGDFERGTVPLVYEGRAARFATPICYEAILPGVCNLYEDAELLVNVTNDAWFGDTAATHQHAMLAAIRSTELGVPLVRSGYTGVSFVVEPHGVIHSETTAFEEVHRVVGVRLGHERTLYALLGDWFVALCLLGLIGGWLSAPRLRQHTAAAD